MIRRYQECDIDAIVDLELKTLNTTLGKDMLKNELDNPFSYIFVYTVENNVVGYISYSFDGDIAEMLNFCVDTNMQGQGIGKELLEYTFNIFKDLSANSSILEVRESNYKAISLYNKFGYKKISVRKAYYSNGENALVLQRLF